MRILVCIDDTDNLESVGTGTHAQEFRNIIEENNLGKTYFISRHQLYVHKDVSYTSHNSSMCFEADVKDKKDVEKIIKIGKKHLEKISAEGSDPGLCVAIKDDIKSPQSLIAYSKKAKCSLLTKKEAYGMAKSQGIHLSEHGGDGQGVVGALAGVGLRYFGNDGRVKGKIEINSDKDILTVSELLNKTNFERILTLDGKELKYDEKIFLTDKRVKAILIGWKSTILVRYSKAEEIYKTLAKEEYKCY